MPRPRITLGAGCFIFHRLPPPGLLELRARAAVMACIADTPMATDAEAGQVCSVAPSRFAIFETEATRAHEWQLRLREHRVAG